MSSFINSKKGRGYAPGWFLAHEECTRETRNIPQTGALVNPDGSKYVPMGTVFPSNDENAAGIVYEDVNVSDGSMPGSVVTAGTVYENRLPAALDPDAKTALEASGFKFMTEPAITRPETA